MARVINTERESAEGGISYQEYISKYRLPEQAEAEHRLLKYKHHVLAFEPGKSKSYPIIWAIRYVNHQLKGAAKVLILSDAGTIKDMWKAEIEPQKILPAHTVMLSDRSATYGSKSTQRGMRLGDMARELLDTKWDIIVVDECQSLRSGINRAKSLFAKLMHRLAKDTPYVWGMTGTISGNSDIEPFAILHNLHVNGCGDYSISSFKNVMCVQEMFHGPFGSFYKPVRLNDTGLKFMADKYDTAVTFWAYDENDDMPELNITEVEFIVPVTKEYKNAMNGIIQCGDYENTVIKASAIQKAHQSLNGFLYYDTFNEDGKKSRVCYKIPNFTNPKLSYIVNRVLEMKPLIIAYRFQEDYNVITEKLKELKIKHTSNIQEFKELGTKEMVVLVLQAQRGKAVNLQFCKTIIYYTSDFSFISYKQLIHRCWRRGQQETCEVVFLINNPQDRHQVERKIWNALRTKQNIHDLLMSIKED